MSNYAAAAQYADLVTGAAQGAGIEPALLAALVDHESSWNPRAYRAEVKINDASRGLGQLLFKTAQGLGYQGAADDLFDPAINLPLTAKYLSQQIAKAGGDVQGGLSAYNGGYRPSHGFGARAAAPLTVVLARSQTTGEPITTRQVPAGEFANQPYVDTIMARYSDFTTSPSSPFAPPVGDRSPDPADVSDVVNPTPHDTLGGASALPLWILGLAIGGYALTKVLK